MTIKIAVGVPTYKRVESLKRCLKALDAQSYKASQIILTVSQDDDETREFLKTLEVGNVYVLDASDVHFFESINKILNAFKADVIAFTDDDAQAPVDWLEKIAKHYEADTTLGALGGRDFIDHDIRPISPSKIGRVSYMGRRYGNHHRKCEACFEVDYLKGVNMSFRAEAVKDVRLDRSVLTSDSMDAYEPHLCFKVKQRDWKILYDSELVVKHWVEKRQGQFTREAKNRALADFENFYKTLLFFYPSTLKKMTFTLYAFLIGEKKVPGLLFLPIKPLLTLKSLTMKIRAFAAYFFN